jgi:hypothetical protein
MPNPNDKDKITFKDVAGADEEKQELEEIVEYLKAPAKFSRLGARFPTAFCSWALPVPVKHCWLRQLQAKPAFPSSPFPVRTLLKCTLV